MYRILIWGTGKRAENYLLKNYFCNCEIIGFIDTYKKDDRFMQHKVFRPEDLPEIKDCSKRLKIFFCRKNRGNSIQGENMIQYVYCQSITYCIHN